MELERVRKLIDRCFRESGVFSREVVGGGLFESDVIKKEGRNWLAIASGISGKNAEDYFPASGAKSERAVVPLSVLGVAQASVLFVVRPINLGEESYRPDRFVCPFAPGDKIPFLEIREGHVRLWGLENEIGIVTLRWELDRRAGNDQPLEPWLKPWAEVIGSNPAHAPSHLHANSVAIIPGSDENERMAAAPNDLRLAIGTPNPLSLILSIGAWIRAE